MMYCKLQMLFTIVYCSEPTKRIQAILGYSLPKTLSPGVASGILVTSCSLAALITQATATASLRCRNASCGFRSVAEPLDSRLRNPTAPLGSAWNFHCTTYVPKTGCMKLPPQELQECPGLQVQLVQLALLLFSYH